MSHPVLISTKNFCFAFACLFLSSNILCAQKKNVLSYDLMNARKSYAPLHLQYERILAPRFSIQMSVNRFRVEPVQLLPKNTTTTVHKSSTSTGDGFLDFVLFGFGRLLNGKEPEYGTMTADFNQRGTMIGFGPKLYLAAQNRVCRPYVQADFQYYAYRYDQYRFTRTKGWPIYSNGGSQYDVTTSEQITKNHQKSTMAARLDGGFQFNFSNNITAEMGVSVGIHRGNSAAEDKKGAFQVNSKLNGVPQVPIRAALVGPVRLSVGYRF